ncbi:hypothetical protein LCGC14_0463840 [marine sediment metagenome]|uniref:Uncharacterized protein n=1 Tax=marine sediment metagenome TaxID=412755 RepID=A0A0F9V121_9ZZZZ
MRTIDFFKQYNFYAINGDKKVLIKDKDDLFSLLTGQYLADLKSFHNKAKKEEYEEEYWESDVKDRDFMSVLYNNSEGGKLISLHGITIIAEKNENSNN